jgi:Glycosyl hydrolase catalytic core
MKATLAALAAAGFLGLSIAGCGTSNNGSTEEPISVPRAPEEFFGVVPQTLLTDEDLERMRQGKVGHVRLVIPWGALVPDQADQEVDLSSVDPVVLNSAEAGIRVIPTIYGTPTWVAQELDNYDCDDDCGAYAPSSHKALAAWKDFVGQMVDRYGPDGSLWEGHPDVDAEPVRSWQIWNEQNSPTFYQPEVDPAGYAKLVETAAEAITERDPEAELVLGGMFGTPFQGRPPALSSWDFLREMYAIEGARDTFDAVAAHPYAAHEAKIEDQVERLYEEVGRAEDDAGLWVTEVGASSDEGENPLEQGPEGQAEQLRAAFEFFIEQREALNIEGVTWYSWRDSGTPQCDWCAGSGLFEAASPLTPKPSWEAFVSFTGGS